MAREFGDGQLLRQAARPMRLGDYGVALGSPADLVMLHTVAPVLAGVSESGGSGCAAPSAAATVAVNPPGQAA